LIWVHIETISSRGEKTLYIGQYDLEIHCSFKELRFKTISPKY
jgi:hypothetical protein